jgi:hypothetical protein
MAAAEADSKVAPIRERVVIADAWFLGEQPAANGHLLRSRRHPRRRSRRAAAPGHVATSRGAWPGDSCCCRPRSHRRRRQGHAAPAESSSQSSVFLLRANGEDLLANSAKHATTAGELSQGYDARPGIRSRASVKSVPRQPGSSNPRSLGSGASEKVSYRPRQMTEAAAGWFATPGQEADIAGPFCAALKLARPRRPTTPGAKSGTLPESCGRKIRGLALPCSSR